MLTFQAIKKKLDATWSNIYSGINTRFDKSKHLTVIPYQRKSDVELVNQYASDGLCAKIIDYIPEQMLKKHVEIKHEKAKEIENEFYNYLNLDYKILQALRWSRAFGGSVIIPVFDSTNLMLPFNQNEIKGRLNPENIIVLDRRYIYPENYTDPFKPSEYYDVIGISGKTFKIHKSRLIIFDGIDVSMDLRLTNMGWGESIINRIDDGLKAWGVGYCSSLSNLIQELKVGVLKLNNLNDQIAQNTSESEQEIINKLAIINLSKSYVNGMVIDKEDDFINVPVQLSGLKDLLQGIKDLICTLSKIPHDRLFGESPGSSLGEGGKNQQTNFYDLVKQEQSTNLSQQMQKLLNIVGLSIGITDNIEFEFCILEESDEKEEAETEKLEAETEKIEIETYKILIESGIYTAQDIKQKLEEKEKEDYE